jgi:Ser-tRNA(Ala) deacylase AlaX
MTTKRYLADAALAGEAEVVELIEGPTPVVRLSQTWFHAQGGGQKGDRGMIGDARVTDVRHGPDGVVDHHVESLAGLAVGQTYPFSVDADWRSLNSVSHTAGHLIAAVCERLLPGLSAVNGHHWPSEARVEFAGDGLERIQAQTAEIEAALADCLAADMSVAVCGDPFTDRSIRIGDFPAVPCGGAHVASLARIGAIRIRSVKIKGDRARVGYEADVA